MILSAILPVYNVENVLERCIESILNQTFKDFELIIINDGSEDRSKEICNYYAKQDPRIEVIHIKNSGVSKARNIGISKARGSYLQFIDSDDYIAPEMFEILIRNIQEKDSDLVICGLKNLRNEIVTLISPNDLAYINIEDGKNEIISLYTKNLLNSPCNKLYKKKLVSNFPENLSLGEDLIFNLRYLEEVKSFTCISNILYTYDNSSSMSLTKIHRSDIIGIALLLDESIQKFLHSIYSSKEESIHLNSFFIRDLFYATQRTILYSEFERNDKELRLERIINNKRVKLAIRHFESNSLQIRIYSILLKREQKKLLYLFFLLKMYIMKIRKYTFL